MQNIDTTASENDPSSPGGLELGILDTFVGYHLRRASSVVAADFNNVIGQFGMRQVPFAVLTMVARHDGVHQGAIGQALGIQRANMVALVSDLSSMGLIKRSESPDDRRAFALSVTRKGKDLIKSCVELLNAHEKMLLADFTPKERKAFINFLGRIEAQEADSRLRHQQR